MADNKDNIQDEESNTDLINDLVSNKDASTDKDKAYSEESKEGIYEHVKEHDDASKEHEEESRPAAAQKPAIDAGKQKAKEMPPKEKVKASKAKDTKIEGKKIPEHKPAAKDNAPQPHKAKKPQEEKPKETPKKEKAIIEKKEMKKSHTETKKRYSTMIHKNDKKNLKKAVAESGKDNAKQAHKKPKNAKNLLLWIGIGLLAVILVIALIFMLKPAKEQAPQGNQTENSVAATVNGEAIYLQDVLTEYNNMNPLVKSMSSVETVLNNSITRLLLVQEAKKKGLTVSEDEMNAIIEGIKVQNNLTDKEVEDALAKQGMTLKEFKTKIIERDLLVEKLLNETIFKDTTTTESQVKAYYDLNIEKFKVPEQVTVQHILVLVTPNVTDAMAKEKINNISKELTNSNFCELVAKYSDDTASIKTCGKYTFAKGDFGNPEFENPSFDLKINETTIVKVSGQSYTGYHLIKKLEALPAKITSLSEAYAQVNQTVYNQNLQKKFNALVANLTSEATIVNYVTKIGGNGSEIAPLPKSLDDFAKCITEKGAAFYGASWCAHCKKQKELFGDSLKYVNYVECAVEDQPQVQTEACTKAGISGYPTWIINGKSYPGEQSIEKLAQLTGCTAP